MPLANGHGRYMLYNRYTRTETCVRWLMALHISYKFVTVSLLKLLRNGRFASETATWIPKWFKIRWYF